MDNYNRCQLIHNKIMELKRYYYIFDKDNLPKNGVYVIFENGESGHSGDRIVHIGTHKHQDGLVKRLEEIFKIENKDRSILRKNIGSSILNKNNDPYLDIWEMDLTSVKNKEEHFRKVDKEHQSYIEKLVTEYIQDNFTFAIIDEEDKDKRLRIKKWLIGEISNCSHCTKSDYWLGNYSTNPKIVQSGLWNNQGLYNTDLIEEIKFLIND
jgi:hypothetical protein